MIKQKSSSTTSILPLSDDKERDEIHEVNLLSLTIHKTAKVTEEQENMAIIQEKLLEEDINKMVDGDYDSYASEFFDSVFLNDEEDFGNRLCDGSLEVRNEEKQTLISTTPRSPRIELSLNKDISQELTVSTSPPQATSSKRSKPISMHYAHILGTVHMMCRRQGIMMQQVQKKFVLNNEFQNIKERVNRVLNDNVPKIALNATNDLINDNLLRMVESARMKEKLHKLLYLP
nr:hypothetical protein [Tanacetum cinerariifolium]